MNDLLDLFPSDYGDPKIDEKKEMLLNQVEKLEESELLEEMRDLCPKQWEQMLSEMRDAVAEVRYWREE